MNNGGRGRNMSSNGHGGIISAKRKKNFWLTTMLLPGAVWLLLLRYLPMLGITIAFKNYRAFKPNTFWNNILKSEWVGLKNFEFLKGPDTDDERTEYPLHCKDISDDDVFPLLPELGCGELLCSGVP